MSLVDEVKAKEEMWDSRDDIDELMDEATKALSARTKSMAFAEVKDPAKGGTGAKDRFWQAGHTYIFRTLSSAISAIVKTCFPFLMKWTSLIKYFWLISDTIYT